MSTKLYPAPAMAGTSAKPVPRARLVLVVDDDEANRLSVCELLADRGYEVWEAADGRLALERLVATRDRVPDALVMDLSMPLMSGWELLAILKAYVRLSAIPVVLLSGVEPQLDPVKHGAIAAYLRKPCSGAALLEAVAKAMALPGGTSPG